MKSIKLFDEFYEEKIEEDFAAIGTPPAGNVSGMGPVTAPAPGNPGSGDSWPSLGTPAVQIQVSSPICPICKKTRKACRCEDGPSERKKKKIKNRVSEMKHVNSFEKFLFESNFPPSIKIIFDKPFNSTTIQGVSKDGNHKGITVKGNFIS